MSETAQTDAKAASDPEHVALNVDIPAGEETFTELHDVSFVCLTGFAPCPIGDGSITCSFGDRSIMCPFGDGSITCPFRDGSIMCSFGDGSITCPFRGGSVTCTHSCHVAAGNASMPNGVRKRCQDVTIVRQSTAFRSFAP